MEDRDLKHRLHLMQTDIEATASVLNDAKINLTAALDSMKKIELGILKNFMARYHPELAKAYPTLKEGAIYGEVAKAAQGGRLHDRSIR